LKRYGFTKADKILKHSQFTTLSNSGKSVQDYFFIVVFLPGSGKSRLGITVSKRVGNAVLRNRLKRLIRETFRVNRNLMKGQWDLNVIAKRRAAGATYQQAFHSLKMLLSKIERYES